eukprot:6007753-Amphidinium_carterae.1
MTVELRLGCVLNLVNHRQKELKMGERSLLRLLHCASLLCRNDCLSCESLRRSELALFKISHPVG